MTSLFGDKPMDEIVAERKRHPEEVERIDWANAADNLGRRRGRERSAILPLSLAMTPGTSISVSSSMRVVPSAVGPLNRPIP